MKKLALTLVAAFVMGSAAFASPVSNAAVNSNSEHALDSGLEAVFTNPVMSGGNFVSWQINDCRTSAYYETSSSTFAEIFFDVFSDVLAAAWLVDNLAVTFDAYPYADGDYLNFDLSSDGLIEGKSYRFALDASAFSLPSFGSGVGARLEGYIWKFFGPILEVYAYNRNENDTILSVTEGVFPADYVNLRLGAEFALFQLEPISASWYIQWGHMFDRTPSGSDALVLGFICRSYPFAPVLLEWRVFTQMFGEDEENARVYYSDWVESHLELGIMVSGPWEIFGAWNYYANNGLHIVGSGFEAGVRLHL